MSSKEKGIEPLVNMLGEFISTAKRGSLAGTHAVLWATSPAQKENRKRWICKKPADVGLRYQG